MKTIGYNSRFIKTSTQGILTLQKKLSQNLNSMEKPPFTVIKTDTLKKKSLAGDSLLRRIVRQNICTVVRTERNES